MEGPISIAALKDAIAAAHMKEPSKIVLEKCKTDSTLNVDDSHSFEHTNMILLCVQQALYFARNTRLL